MTLFSDLFKYHNALRYETRNYYEGSVNDYGFIEFLIDLKFAIKRFERAL